VNDGDTLRRAVNILNAGENDAGNFLIDIIGGVMLHRRPQAMDNSDILFLGLSV